MDTNLILTTISNVFQWLGNKASYLFTLIFGKISDKGLNFPVLLGKLITIFILGFLLWLSFKIGWKILKIVLVIVFILLILSVFYSTGIDVINAFYNVSNVSNIS